MKKSIVLNGPVGTILVYFTAIMAANLVLSLTLFTAEILVTEFSDDDFPLTTDMIKEIRQAIEYVASYSEMACVYLFFFKLKQVEIQIDLQSSTVIDILKNLQRLRNRVRCSFVALVILNLIFVVCYTVNNIGIDVELNNFKIFINNQSGSAPDPNDIKQYEEKHWKVYVEARIFLAIIQTPCNIFLASVLFCFMTMGRQLISHYTVMGGNDKAQEGADGKDFRKASFLMHLMIFLSLCQLIFNVVLQVYPFVLTITDSHCSEFYKNFF